ncbi:hypothetical protein M878_41895 [Streptomyces roseochromogenus subsp. oscitans DS 12.976]|uniref:Potassium/proton antiporter subunit KhtT-like N-terminal domain-containing protein n=1 Tax=Streptomyces roseochromogenus subsp. oscitans DS 12.976 TaxID=1352936 RepID=V6JKC5_STRRC|nr:hypothetical protein M878_41895 [Streptomyces roseochromogenus subsp. oscitans DS 12.976]
MVTHRDGSRTLSADKGEDPDACALSIRLSGQEAEALAGTLNPTHHSPSLLSTMALGLVAERIALSAAS